MWRDAGREDISGDAMWDVGGQTILCTVLLITNVHHDNETTFAIAETGFDNLACSLVMTRTVRVHGSKLGTPCSSMMAAVLTVAEKTATMRHSLTLYLMSAREEGNKPWMLGVCQSWT